MIKRRTVVLVERAYLIQAGIGKLLDEVPGMVITAIFDGSEKRLSEKINNKKPDLVFINPHCVADNAISLVKGLHNKGCLIVGLLKKDTLPNIKSLFKYHLTPTDGKYELLEELKSVVGKLPASEPHDKENSALSEREITILKKVVSGLTTQEIADRLFLSVHTVNTHRKNITNKLGIKTVSGLTVFALMNKIVHLNEIDSK